jgi:hypothetical protein
MRLASKLLPHVDLALLQQQHGEKFVFGKENCTAAIYFLELSSNLAFLIPYKSSFRFLKSRIFHSKDFRRFDLKPMGMRIVQHQYIF